VIVAKNLTKTILELLNEQLIQHSYQMLARKENQLSITPK